MSRPGDLARLAALAALRRDAGLARLSVAAEACARTEAQIATLAERPPSLGVDPLAAELNALSYARWAAVQRRRLAEVLAVEEQARDAARAEAAAAFARAAVLDRLAMRQREADRRLVERRRGPG